ncbi:MAG TPA: cellulase family glycosylhydrolase [Planctomycetota bacterium]|jgi:endo-1,4-beta-mannosidase
MNRILIVTLVFGSSLAANVQCAESAPARLKVSGQEILAPDGKPIRLRGFNVLWWGPPTAQDAADVQELGANCVRYQFGYKPAGKFDPKQLNFMEQQIRHFTGRGMWVIPQVHTFEKKISDKQIAAPWNDAEIQREFLEMWTWIIEKFRSEPFIAAWEPINEPHNATKEQVKEWYVQTVAHFRKLDPITPIVVEGTDYSNPWNLEDYLKLDDPGIIYSFHMYTPHEYTHQQKEKPQDYPGKWSRAFLAEKMSPVIKFREKHNVPVYCGEWGAVTLAPNYEQWLRDVGSILEENALPWTHWAWMVKPQPVNDTFDCNKAKVGIYKVMSQVFKDALPKK